MGLIFLKINIKKSHAVAQSTHRGTCTPNSALSEQNGCVKVSLHQCYSFFYTLPISFLFLKINLDTN